MPKGSAISVDTIAIRIDNWTATQSWGERSSKRNYDTGLIRKLKP